MSALRQALTRAGLVSESQAKAVEAELQTRKIEASGNYQLIHPVTQQLIKIPKNRFGEYVLWARWVKDGEFKTEYQHVCNECGRTVNLDHQDLYLVTCWLIGSLADICKG